MKKKAKKKIAKKSVKLPKMIDCDCAGWMCCGGRGIAVFEVTRDGKVMRVCTRCDLGNDKNRKILKYVMKLPGMTLVNFDSLGAMCLMNYIQEKKYPFTKYPYGSKKE